MATLRAFQAIDMTDLSSSIGDVEYADEDLVVVGDYVRESYYYGNFSFPNGEWKGTIHRVFAYYDGEELWHVTGLHLSTKYATAGSTTDEAYRTALSGDDSMIGSGFSDKLVGYSGDDRMWGGRGSDRLSGSSGDDTLKGQSGNDRLIGGSGRDIIQGGTGNDKLSGGASSDVFVFNKADGHDSIADYGGHDRIEIDSGATSYNDLTIVRVGDDVEIRFADTVISVLDAPPHVITHGDFLFGA